MKTNHYKTTNLFSMMISKRYFLVLALFFGLQNAWAQSVISATRDGNVYYLTHNEAGTSVETTPANAFNPSTCIWYLNNNTIRTANANGVAFGGNNYLQINAINLGSNSVWYTAQNDREVQATNNGNNSTFLRYSPSSNAWQINTYSNHATAYAVTIQTVAAVTTVTVPTISPLSAELNFNESQAFTATATATTEPAYTIYTFNGNTVYYFNNTAYTSEAAMRASAAWVAATAAPTVTYTWTLAGAANSYLSPTSGTGANITITHSSQAPSDLSSVLSVTASATANGQTGTSTSNATVTALAPQVDPESITVSASMTIYVGQTGTISYTLTPNPCFNNVDFTSNDPSIATVNSSGVVTGVAVGSTTITVTAYKIDGTTDANLTGTVTVNVRNKVATPEITFTANREGTASTTITCATAGATIYYKVNGAASYTTYSVPFDVNEYDEVQAYASMVGNPSWDDSETETQQYVPCSTAAPVITYAASGSTATVTITAEADATIYYTYGDTPADPTPTSYNGTGTASVTFSGPTNGQVVKAIAKNGTCSASSVVSKEIIISGVSGGTVILYDCEDHNWSYYSNYTDKPDNDYPNNLLSPDPRNVKIIYDGNGGEVSYNESENQFIYYKTIEKINNAYTYKVIPNPFSKRPTVGTGNDRWRGFGGWKIISGAEFISGHNNNDVLTLEETLTLTGLDAGYTKNCLSATIELQATWVQAYVSTVNGAGDITSRPNTLTGSTYETNFIVILDNRNHTVSGTGLVTISNRYPDGSPGGTGTVNGCTTSPGGTKVEFTNISGIFTERDGQLIVGRGCTGTVSEVNGNNANRVKNIRLESGTYSFVHPLQGMGDNDNNRGTYIFGCDYDRANVTNAHPYGDNTKLRIVVFTAINGSGGHANNSTDDLQNITIKSGYYGFTSDYAFWQNDKTDGWGLGVGGNTDNVNDEYVVPDENGVMRTYTWGTKPPQNTMSFYVGPTRGGGKGGRNVLRVEGGELSSINGGGTTTPDEFIRFDFRMTGGWVKGAIYGGASAVDCNGSSKIVITGGEVNSWVGGGCNGTDLEAGAGATNGTIYIYAGGNAQLRSHNSDGFYNNAWGLVNHIEGGQIYGGGRGMGAPGSYSGSATKAYVVVADESFVEQNVYGGSCHGVSQDGYVYILGGTIGKNVFGGSFEPTSTNNTWQARNTHVRMYGGLVKGGIYGGNDASGTVTQDAEILILDGQVGIDASHTANIHGGGYGQATRVNGNVDVRLGTCNATTGVTVFGDVYGGSALGNVNTNASNTTTVSLYKGTIYGGLYGGGLGSNTVAAAVNGAVAVKVYGGSVLCSATDPVGEAGTGSVFGCNNVNGAPQSTVTVDIYSTDQPASGYALHAVYGGGNKAPYTRVPVVTVHGCNNSIEYVYGGGNATDVRGTDVTIWGGTIGNAFGGGNGFSETGNHNDPNALHYNPGANITDEGTNLKIYGGEIISAFGGSNQYGRINSTINVTVDTKTEPGSDPCSGVAYEECDLVIDELYGGGNEAPIQTSGNVWITPTVQVLACDAYIKNFFGGAKKADYGGNIVTNIVAGRFDNVFGGNNQGGVITGDVTLNLQGGTIGNAFGGCNEDGNITGSITVNVIDGELECPLYITNVYGGGQDAAYTPNNANLISPKVNINHTRRGTSVYGSVYGGGKGAGAVVTANPYVTVGDDNDNHYSIVSGEVYGGGNAAAVIGNTEVLIKNRAKVIGNIYGGGNMGAVNGDTKVIINGRIN